MLNRAIFLIAFSTLLLWAGCKKDAGPEVCDTTSVSFKADVLPILKNNCFSGCHNGSSPTSGFKLETYQDVKAKVDDGRLVGAVTRQPGFVAMPFNRPVLPQCEQDIIVAWVTQGALDN